MASKELKKCNSRPKFVFSKAKYLKAQSRRLLASALVQCHLDYACCFWYNSLSNGSKNYFGQFTIHLNYLKIRLDFGWLT